MRELLGAGQAVFDELKNLCVWTKTNGGMGSFYRSKHELVFVFKQGSAPTQQLSNSAAGRYRTNVWDYAGANSFGGGPRTRNWHCIRPSSHRLITDILRMPATADDIVLDGFGGSGTTLIAAEHSGRQGPLIELDPLYCDVILAPLNTRASARC